MKICHDVIWGDIAISDVAISIIDTPEFQRMHEIRQTGLAYKVFPTASHSRFEHSLGVYHLSGVIVNKLNSILHDDARICDRTIECVKIAGLCHDLGHGAYSHMFDNLFLKKQKDIEKYPWRHHEKRSQDIFRYITYTYNIALTSSEVDLICNLIHVDANDIPWWWCIVHNPINGIDSDKLDYLIRDNRAMGVPLNINMNRIIENIRVINNEICYCDRIKDDIFNLFYIRYRSYREIYCHPTVVRFELLMTHVMEKLNNDHNIINIIKNKNVREFCKLTDSWVRIMGDDAMLRDIDQRIGGRRDDVNGKKITINVGFVGGQNDPFVCIKFYTRKSPHVSFKIPPSKINMFLKGDNYLCNEEITYGFMND